MTSPRRILFLGDSYTEGTGVSPQQAWPHLLVSRMNARGAGVEAHVIAQSGWTTGDLLEAVDREALEGPYDLITLLVGANNQYQGRSLGEYRMQLSALLERTLQLVNHRALRVVVISIPDWSVSPFADGRDRYQISREIDAFNTVNLEEAGRRGVLYAEITEISRSFEDRPDAFAEDRLHPGPEQFEAWMAKLFPLVNSLLGQTTAPWRAPASSFDA